MLKKFILILFVVLVSFTGCSLQTDDLNFKLEDKATSEIEYLEDEIFSIVNKFAKGEYIKDDVLEWDNINKDSQKISNCLDTVMLDFGEVKISNEELNKFRNEVNNLLISTTNEDENSFLKSISNLYSLLPEYFGKFSEDKNKKDIMILKSLILKSFVSSNLLEWEEAKASALEAENKYKEMSDNIEYMKEYSYNLNKVYILVGEFKNAIDQEQKDLARIKYINFMEKS